MLYVRILIVLPSFSHPCIGNTQTFVTVSRATELFPPLYRSFRPNLRQSLSVNDNNMYIVLKFYTTRGCCMYYSSLWSPLTYYMGVVSVVSIVGIVGIMPLCAADGHRHH